MAGAIFCLGRVCSTKVKTRVFQINKNEAFVGFVVTSFLIIIFGENIMQSVEFIIYFKVIFSTQKAKSHLFNYCMYCNYTP